jgi:hypothetical protein
LFAFKLLTVLKGPNTSHFMGFQKINQVISPTLKRTEGRAPVSGSEFTSKKTPHYRGGPAETAVG